MNLAGLLAAFRPPAQTGRVIYAIEALLAIGLVVLLAYGFSLRPPASLAFIVIGVLVALAAFLSGAAVGLLFGLPSRSKVDPALAAERGGFSDGTGLEQIADWLTKLVLGATLTQIRPIADAFDALSHNVTHDLFCPAARTGCGGVAGGSLVCGYALGGFVIAYLWMRRWFVAEMVSQDSEVIDTISKRALDDARSDKRVQRRNDASGLRSVVGFATRREQTSGVGAILASGERLAPAGARERAQALQPGQDDEDPWRGAFGGVASAGDEALTATVAATPGDPSTFEIDLTVLGVTPEAQVRLAGQAAVLYLHPTFGDEARLVAFGADGRARLQLFGYGAFTVGALLPDGRCLELNLATLPGAPVEFRQR